VWTCLCLYLYLLSLPITPLWYVQLFLVFTYLMSRPQSYNQWTSTFIADFLAYLIPTYLGESRAIKIRRKKEDLYCVCIHLFDRQISLEYALYYCHPGQLWHLRVGSRAIIKKKKIISNQQRLMMIIWLIRSATPVRYGRVVKTLFWFGHLKPK